MQDHQEFLRAHYAGKMERLDLLDRLTAKILVFLFYNKARCLKIYGRVWLVTALVPIVVAIFWTESQKITLLGLPDRAALVFFLSTSFSIVYWTNLRVLRAWLGCDQPPFIVTLGDEDLAVRHEERARRNLLIFSSLALVYFVSDADFASLPLLGGALANVGSVAGMAVLAALIVYFYFQFLSATMSRIQLKGGLGSMLPLYFEPTKESGNMQGFWDGLLPALVAALALSGILTAAIF